MDYSIKSTLKHSYAHHIERLMIQAHSLLTIIWHGLPGFCTQRTRFHAAATSGDPIKTSISHSPVGVVGESLVGVVGVVVDE